MKWQQGEVSYGISIHALLAESDKAMWFIIGCPMQFLSTLSLRRATGGRSWMDVCIIFLSTLSLRRATVSQWTATWNLSFLSTLSLRRATPVRDIIQWEGMNFYPRSPCGERLTLIQKLAHLCLISIHALLAESDRNY